jgi:hypothetical protein
MPQVWVTYEELGELLDCDAAAAREKSVSCGWRRRVCGDGLTRVKLLPAMAHEYMVSYANETQGVAGADQLIASLRDVLQREREGESRRNIKRLAW